MKKVIVLLLLLMLPHTVTFASADKAAHFGVGYVLNDQLKQHTKLTFCERMLVIGAIAYAKEKSDRYVDNRDLLATLGGALMFQVRF